MSTKVTVEIHATVVLDAMDAVYYETPDDLERDMIDGALLMAREQGLWAISIRWPGDGRDALHEALMEALSS